MPLDSKVMDSNLAITEENVKLFKSLFNKLLCFVCMICGEGAIVLLNSLLIENEVRDMFAT